MFKHGLYYHSDLRMHPSDYDCLTSVLTINKMSISFLNMMYEGYSCMYGGMYIVYKLSPDASEVLSHCDPSSIIYGETFYFDIDMVIIIIHYMEYSGPTIIFEEEIVYIYDMILSVDQKIGDIQSVNITVPDIASMHPHKLKTLYFQSMLLYHINMKYIYITFEREDMIKDEKFNPGTSDL